MGATVTPDKILKQLSDLWVDTAKQSQDHPEAGVLRACTMTLVVVAEASEDTQSLGETIAALVPEHPARTILVRLSGPGQRAVAGRVYHQCWMPFGQRRQICCEQVELIASDAALGDLRAVVLPLAVADVPVVLWCRSTRLPEMREFWQIAAMSRKVILDSASAPDQTGALMRLAAMAASGMMLGDLSWTRLTRWREMLSQVFVNQQNFTLLCDISKVQVEWGGAYQASAAYLGAWIRDSLHSAGVQAELEISPTLPDSLRIRLTGGSCAIEVARQDERMVVTINGVEQHANLSHPNDYLLMREELGILRHDPVFEQTLVSAARLAYPEDK